MIWKERHLNLGTVKSGKEIDFYFLVLDDKNQKIKNIEAGCASCTKASFKINKIIVKFKLSIPYHLMHLGNYTTSRSIVVRYEDGTTDVLSFTATLIQ